MALVIACVWMINAINNRPKDFKWERQMHNALLPYDVEGAETEMDEEIVMQETHHKRNPWNLFCLPRFQFDLLRVPTPRLHSQVEITEEWFDKIAGISCKEIRFLIGADEASRDGHLRVNTLRVQNKTQRTDVAPKLKSGEALISSLQQKGIELTERQQDEGSDVENERDNIVDVTTRIDEELTSVWRQFQLDLFLKAPNQSTSGSEGYCRLSEYERKEKFDEALKTPELSKVWRVASIRAARQTEWDELFDWFWRDSQYHVDAMTNGGKMQNIGQMLYREQWRELLGRLPSRLAIAQARQDLRKQWNLMMWMPKRDADRVWMSKTTKKGFKFYTLSTDKTPKPGPHIIFNPALWHEFTWSDDSVVLGREADE
jgi:hypothetical protein